MEIGAEFSTEKKRKKKLALNETFFTTREAIFKCL